MKRGAHPLPARRARRRPVKVDDRETGRGMRPPLQTGRRSRTAARGEPANRSNYVRQGLRSQQATALNEIRIDPMLRIRMFLLLVRRIPVVPDLCTSLLAIELPCWAAGAGAEPLA